MTKDCCVWFKRRKGNAAHQPTSNGVPQPSSDKTLAKQVLGCLVCHVYIVNIIGTEPVRP